MKTLLALLLCGQMYAQQVDKVAHLGLGYIAGATISATTLILSNGKNETLKSLSVGIGSGVILGTAKEFYDFKSYGVFNWQDLGVTVLGSALGSVTIKISINFYERKHLI